MKYFLTLVIILFSGYLFGQQISYPDWKQEAKSNIRLLPKYGNVPKTESQKNADEEMKKTYLSQEGTPRKASELLIKLGFDYLYKGDLKTAMYRFNQAWLLDPENENVFWGFGAIYFQFHDFENALQQYDEGLIINSNSSNLLTDKATVYFAQFHISNAVADIDKALNLFEHSYAIDPTNQNTLFKASACFLLKNDCTKALKYYNECKELGGKPITKEYAAAISTKCNL